MLAARQKSAFYAVMAITAALLLAVVVIRPIMLEHAHASTEIALLQMRVESLAADLAHVTAQQERLMVEFERVRAEGSPITISRLNAIETRLGITTRRR